MSSTNRFDVGERLCPAEAAYLQDCLKGAGIDSVLRDAEDGDSVVEVAEGDHARAMEIHATSLGAEETPAHDTELAGRRRRVLAATTGVVAVLYAGKGLAPPIRLLGALALGALIYVLMRRPRDIPAER